MNLPNSTESDPFSAQNTSLYERFQNIRQLTLTLCEPLKTEDFIIQSMPDVSPPKWHLAHTTWFFEIFLLKPFLKNYPEFNSNYHYLFNSYYKGLGKHHPRAERGLLSRPSLEEIYEYRDHVNHWIEILLNRTPGDDILTRIRLGCHHEQQHQELLLTDIKHIFFKNPLRPLYRSSIPHSPTPLSPLTWKNYPEGLVEIGFEGKDFSFDNERPRHRRFLESFAIASRPITNGEYLEFIQEGGYQNPALWLSDGWDWVSAHNIEAPLYWERRDSQWWEFTLSGMRPLRSQEPVVHVNFYEAEAFARWAGKRLPTEMEWEWAAAQEPHEGNFLSSKNYHPAPAAPENASGIGQLFGDVWEWTGSPYTPYPRFQPEGGAIGEYNGKFMCNQMVLRGGSCFTPADHIRETYRNFFPPQARWQATGIRLAEDI